MNDQSHSPALSRWTYALRDAIADAFKDHHATNEDDDIGLGLLDWGSRYLPEHFSKPPSEMHRWLARRLDNADRDRGNKINLVGPRGGAKSTIATLAYVLRCAVEQSEPYIWIVSDTKHQAQSHLENIKTELLENSALCEAYPRTTGKGPRWRSGGVELRGRCVIDAFGRGQRIRGKRRRAHRPTLIICDDLENDDHMTSAHLRGQSYEWFHGTLLKAGRSDTNIVNLATALHRDALAMRLCKTPGWDTKTFQAVTRWPKNQELWNEWEGIYCDHDHEDAQQRAREFFERHRISMEEGAQVLWPDEEDLYALMCMRVESGATAFEREKQSSPIDPERCEWPHSYFDESCWFDDWPDRLSLKVMALDPSKGNDARVGDYSAIVMLGIDANGGVLVQADLARRNTAQMVSDAVEHYLRFRPEVLGVESNQYQHLLAGELSSEFHRRGQLGAQLSEIHNYTNKVMRIRRLGPYLSQRRIKFKRNCESTELLVDQLRDFPLGSHDDGPDALEMALRLAEETWRTGHEL